MRSLLPLLIFCLTALSIAFAPTDTDLDTSIIAETPPLEPDIGPPPQPNTTFSYLVYFLTNSELYGKWYNEDKAKQHFFQTHGGFSHVSHYKHDSAIRICLYSGIGKNSDHSCFNLFNITPSLDDPPFEEESMTLTFEDVFVHIEEARDHGSLADRDCLASYKFNFISKADELPFEPSFDIKDDRENLAIDFQIQSSNCLINITSRLLLPRYSNFPLVNILDYLIDIVLVGFTVQLLASRWVSENLLTSYNRISLGKLLIIQAFDFYVAFQYWLAETSKLKPAKSIPAPSIMMILAFIASMIHAVAQRQRKLNQPEYSLVRCLNYSLWIIVPGAALTISLVWKEHRAILLVACLYEVPQIVQNFLTKTKYTWDLSIFVFLVLPKVFYISWTLAFADIILGYNCDREINIFCALILVQIFVVIIQTQRPKLWAKVKSPYKMRSQCKIEDMEEVCAICLDAQLNLPKEKSCWCCKRNTNDAEMIVTPCNHQFHQRCLKNWTKQRLSCPYCRTILPSIL